MSVRRVATAVAVAVAALLGLSGVAAASGEVRVPGARLAFDTGSHVFTLTDTADDGHVVYAKWQVRGGSPMTGHNRGGPGAVARWTAAVGTGLDLTYQVCVEGGLRDVCSAPHADRT